MGGGLCSAAWPQRGNLLHPTLTAGWGGWLCALLDVDSSPSHFSPLTTVRWGTGLCAELPGPAQPGHGKQLSCSRWEGPCPCGLGQPHLVLAEASLHSRAGPGHGGGALSSGCNSVTGKLSSVSESNLVWHTQVAAGQEVGYLGCLRGTSGPRAQQSPTAGAGFGPISPCSASDPAQIACCPASELSLAELSFPGIELQLLGQPHHCTECLFTPRSVGEGGRRRGKSPRLEPGS